MPRPNVAAIARNLYALGFMTTLLFGASVGEHARSSIGAATLIASLLFLRCGTSQSTCDPETAAAAEAAAVAHMASAVRQDAGSPVPVFLSAPGGRDPSPALLAKVRDLNVRPLSRARFFHEDPNSPMTVPRDRTTQERGVVVAILSVTSCTSEVVELEVSYSVTVSLLTITRSGDRWQITNEKIKLIVVT